MNASAVEILATLVGVIVAPFIVQSIFKPRTRRARLIGIFGGIIAVLVFLSVWGVYERDPLQIVFCGASSAVLERPLPACADEPIQPAQDAAMLDLSKLFGRWRRAEDPTCDEPLVIAPRGRLLSLQLEGLPFEDHVERRTSDSAFVVVVRPAAVRGQRFQLRLVDNDRLLEVTPLYGGDAALWRKCML